jgi:uncharacterized membrane-anchored protein YhcB (DUF1043 family)
MGVNYGPGRGEGGSEMETWVSVVVSGVLGFGIGWFFARRGSRELKERIEPLETKLEKQTRTMERGFAELRAGHPEKAKDTFTNYYREHDLELPSSGFIVEPRAGDGPPGSNP